MDLARPLSVITPTLDADVLQVLAGANASFTAPQVHRFVGGRSESGVRRTLQRLVVQGIVHVTTTGRTNSYVLNRQHLAAEHVLGLTQLRTRLADAIAEEVEQWDPSPLGLALFGSAARGTMTTKSDIDVFVVQPGDEFEDETPATDATYERWDEQLLGLSWLITEWTGNDARILEYSGREVSAARHSGFPLESVLVDIADHGMRIIGSSADLRPVPGADGRG